MNNLIKSIKEKEQDESNLLKKFFLLNFIHKSWKQFFEEKLKQDVFYLLLYKLKKCYDNKTCFPKKENIFRIFREISLDNIKVVIIGQDPYYTDGIADGFAFSTEKDYIPPSLKNIFLELKNDLKITNTRGDLINWVKQGIFLINASLTVEKNKPLSHEKFWEKFSLDLFEYINYKKKEIIWLFWGNKAKKIKEICKINNNYCLESSHPSPFSCHYGFFNSYPFSKINKILIQQNKKPIKWEIKD